MAGLLKSNKHESAVWKNCRIEDFCTTASGGTPLTTRREYYEGGHIPWLRSGEVAQGRVRYAEISITQAGLDNSSAKLFKKGTILVAMYGATAGEVGILEFESATNQAVCGVTPGPSVDGEFLFQALLLRKSALIKMAGGGAQPNISQEIIRNFKIPLPPLAEQRKIAEILRTWDEAIEAAEAELKAKQERKRWLAMRLISGESRLSGCSSKWEKVRLADLFERVTEKNEELCERCLTISAEKGLVDQREYFDRRISSADTSGYFLMKRGDFAYNRSYSNGYPYGVVKRLNAYDVGTVTTLYLVFTPRNRTFDPLYMEHVFDSGILNKGLRTIVQEGARAHGLLNVKAEDFFSLVVYIPDLNEQSKISKLLSDAQTQITDCESHLELLRNQKRGLMQKLLTGEVRVAA